MLKHLIAGDFQAPYHDYKAVGALLNVAADLKPYSLTVNGDFVDWRVISDHFPARRDREDLVNTFRDEVKVQRKLLKDLVGAAKAKVNKFNEGNHEWRLMRALLKNQAVAELLSVVEVANSVSVQNILELDKYKFEYSGEYPNGCWLHSLEQVPADKNVWIEHGYNGSSNAGYLATKLVNSRSTNTVVNHVERLAVIWKRVVGNRTWFGAEGGALSILAENSARKIYSTVPHTAPELMNHRQGFLVIYEEAGEYWPVPVPIFDGKAVFNGKVYKG